MKLEPRQRRVANLYEMDTDSNFLLMFKTRKNAHLYVTQKQKKDNKPDNKNSKKKLSEKAKTKVTSKLSKQKKNAKYVITDASAGPSVPLPDPLTKQQSQKALTLARKGSQTHRWEFLDDGNKWSTYETEASKLVEMEYQSWLQQPSVGVRSVRSGDWHYAVDFNKLEQTNINHPAHRVRKIRRVALNDGPLPAPKPPAKLQFGCVNIFPFVPAPSPKQPHTTTGPAVSSVFDGVTRAPFRSSPSLLGQPNPLAPPGPFVWNTTPRVGPAASPSLPPLPEPAMSNKDI